MEIGGATSTCYRRRRGWRISPPLLEVVDVGRQVELADQVEEMTRDGNEEVAQEGGRRRR
jgi:hypothetical protein